MNLNPYLNFPGTCEEAMNFYAKALDGKIEAMMRVRGSPMEKNSPPDRLDKIIHARVRWGDHVLMASDAPPDYFKPMQGFSVTINLSDTAEAERIFAVLSEGGNVGMPIQQTFWAKRFAHFSDRFGTPWMINCE
jgi:PhnB protein